LGPDFAPKSNTKRGGDHWTPPTRSRLRKAGSTGLPQVGDSGGEWLGVRGEMQKKTEAFWVGWEAAKQKKGGGARSKCTRRKGDLGVGGNRGGGPADGGG